jgi:hypothetical protein
LLEAFKVVIIQSVQPEAYATKVWLDDKQDAEKQAVLT